MTQYSISSAQLYTSNLRLWRDFLRSCIRRSRPRQFLHVEWEILFWPNCLGWRREKHIASSAWLQMRFSSWHWYWIWSKNWLAAGRDKPEERKVFLERFTRQNITSRSSAVTTSSSSLKSSILRELSWKLARGYHWNKIARKLQVIVLHAGCLGEFACRRHPTLLSVIVAALIHYDGMHRTLWLIS